MNLDELKKMWEEDCQVDEVQLESELHRIPKLHSKYFNLWVDETRKLKLQEIEYQKLKKIKRQYYMGRLPRKFLEQRGWEPVEHDLGLSELPDYLKGDQDLCSIESRIELLKIKITLLKGILDSLKPRGLNIRTAVDYMKFKAGESR